MYTRMHMYTNPQNPAPWLPSDQLSPEARADCLESRSRSKREAVRCCTRRSKCRPLHCRQCRGSRPWKYLGRQQTLKLTDCTPKKGSPISFLPGSLGHLDLLFNSLTHFQVRFRISDMAEQVRMHPGCCRLGCPGSPRWLLGRWGHGWRCPPCKARPKMALDHLGLSEVVAISRG